MYGIAYDDDYDYMQHLREPGMAGADTYFADEQSRFEFLARQGVVRYGNLPLPDEVLPSVGEEEVGLLTRAVPHRGPRLDWDPDVVEALDDEDQAVRENADEAQDYEDYLNQVCCPQWPCSRAGDSSFFLLLLLLPARRKQQTHTQTQTHTHPHSPPDQLTRPHPHSPTHSRSRVFSPLNSLAKPTCALSFSGAHW